MVKIVKLSLSSEKHKFSGRDAEKLRGYIGNLFIDYKEFHHHLDEFRFQYDYSKIQYKSIEGKLIILGIQEAGELLKNLSEKIHRIELGEETYEIEKKLSIEEVELEVGDEEYCYRFETPWFALNQANFSKFKQGCFDLNKHLQNNILEIFKMCNIRAEKRIWVRGNFETCIFYQKDTKIHGFVGTFYTNAILPNDISLGKRKSIGLGRIKKIKEGDRC